MVKTILNIDGMSCSMCESHINDTVRNNFDIKKVRSSHKKGTVEINSLQALDEELLKDKISQTGYKILSIKTEK